MSTPPNKKPEQIQVSNISFLREQDGVPERMLKSVLIDFFERDRSILTAYLSLVEMSEPRQISIALCLKTQFGQDPGMAEKIGRIFALIFNAREHLDIIFMTKSNEAEIARVCKPFFERDKH